MSALFRKKIWIDWKSYEVHVVVIYHYVIYDLYFNYINCVLGASIVRMIRAILGENKFKDALRQYLKEKWVITLNTICNSLSYIRFNFSAKSISTPTELFKVFDSYYSGYSNQTLAELLYNWVYTPGHPYVTVTLNSDGKSVSLIQVRASILFKNQWENEVCRREPKARIFNFHIKNIWKWNSFVNIILKE